MSGQGGSRRRECLHALAAVATAGWVPLGWAQGGAPVLTREFVGKAHELDSGRLVYLELHKQSTQGERWLSGSIRYTLPNGKLVAEKQLDFSKDRFIPLVRTVFHAAGEEEAITGLTPDGVQMVTGPLGLGAGSKSKTVARAPVMAADSGFHAFIQAHLEALVAGQAQQLMFGVVGQLNSFKFRIRRTALATEGGRSVVKLVAEPDSLLRWMVDPLQLVYDTQSRDLLQYEGPSNLTDPATKKVGKVRITYEF